MVTTPEHGAVVNGVQSVIYSILSSDSTISALTKNILDGDPARIQQKYGVPFIVISPPRNKSVKVTQVKWMHTVSVPLVYRCYQESVLRQLHDAIEAAIIEAEDTLQSYFLSNPSFTEPIEDDDEKSGRTVYGFRREVFFTVNTKYYPGG